MICEGKETTAYRVTTVINEAWSIPATHPTVDYTKLWSFELQTLRFHMFNVQPGVTDTTSPVNAGCTTTAPCSPTAPCMGCKDLSQLQTFQATEAVVVGLRKEDEVLRWPLATCGDTLVNSTYGFEDCDYAKNFDTPINLVDL